MVKVIFGIHAVEAVINSNYQSFNSAFIIKNQNNRLYLIYQRLKKLGINVKLVDSYILDKKSDGGIHQGIVAIITNNYKYDEKFLSLLLKNRNKPFLLILDNITDPHNLGACMRSADAAGVHAIIVPKNRSSSLTATVQKVASGAAENIPLIRVTNLVRTLKLLQEHNILVIGTTIEEEHNIYRKKITLPIALIMGSENKGMRRLTRKNCNEFISIPMLGSVSSLNVSVATGICLFEILRQQNLDV
ncbi:MAG: 23S rRNA (guanosine(2251)-2'-O)-methyltransferase RlmB [Pantoea sp. Brub]|nr:23S rRNA (guanosine(2251)-2'-O)-methyltransferase RlmB [Pantoea sp. Brub]